MSADGSVELASIWAQDRNRVLGDGHGMLWRVPGDLKWFMSQTTGCPIIMGRRSFDALPEMLPKRPHIVITRSEDWAPDGVTICHSLEAAIEVGLQMAVEMGAPTAWITGGASIYEATMDSVERLVVTSLDLEVPERSADGSPRSLVHAPVIDEGVWVRDESRSDQEWKPKSGDARWRVTTWIRR